MRHDNRVMASSVFPGLDAPAASFDQPFEMLAACHDRVRRSLGLLQRLKAHVERHGADTQARDAARDVLRYFSMAAPAHQEDEERHVIPVLQASGGAEDREAARRMLEDHASIHRIWLELEVMLQALVAGAVPEAARFSELVEEFVEVHEDHLALEDLIAFPHAAARIGEAGEEAIVDMGREMAERRGVTRG
jgi:hemerythrin-like domain-containing protein